MEAHAGYLFGQVGIHARGVQGFGERDAHHLGVVSRGGCEVVRHQGLLQAEDRPVELEGEKAELVHVDEATLGNGSPSTEASQVNQRGERGSHEKAVVGVGEAADGDPAGRGGQRTSSGWGTLPLTTSSPTWYVSPDGLSPWFDPSSVMYGGENHLQSGSGCTCDRNTSRPKGRKLRAAAGRRAEGCSRPAAGGGTRPPNPSR